MGSVRKPQREGEKVRGLRNKLKKGECQKKWGNGSPVAVVHALSPSRLVAPLVVLVLL